MATVNGLDELIAAASSHRVVVLGECSHDMHELGAIKTAIIRRLVEEHRFSLILLEAGMAATAEGFAGAVEHPADRLRTIYPFYRTEPMYAMVRWLESLDASERPTVAGFDPRVLTTGGAWLAAELERLGYPAAADLATLEPALHDAWRHQQLTGAEESDAAVIEGARATLVDALEWLAVDSGDRGDDLLVERVLHDRLSLLDVIGDEKGYFDWRERHLAANIELFCRVLHPERKTIVWAHNYHAMRRHSAIDGDVSMGEWLDPSIGSDAFIVGLYAAGGVGTYPNRTSFPIAPAPAGSLEHHGLADGEEARATVFGDADGWWRTPCLTRSFGIEEETLVPAEHFDAVIVVREVSQPRWLDLDLVRRLPV